MNLPDYFLADLPPEATLTEVMINEACQTLKHNREQYLAGRSTQSLINLLSETADNWLQPDFSFRGLALEKGPAATGFSQATLANGLDVFFKQITRENLHALLLQELGQAQRLDGFVSTQAEQKMQQAAMASGPEMLFQIAPGNVPCPTLLSMILGLLLRSAQFVKCASGGGAFARAVCALSLRSRAEAGLVSGNRGMARRHPAGFGSKAVRGGGLRHCHRQRSGPGRHPPSTPGSDPLYRIRTPRQLRLRSPRSAWVRREESGRARGAGRGCMGPTGLPFASCDLCGTRRDNGGGAIRRSAGGGIGAAQNRRAARDLPRRSGRGHFL